MKTRVWVAALFAVAWLAPASLASAQSIADRVDEVRDGKIRLSFAARAGVCGDGHGWISTRGGLHISSDRKSRRWSEDWESECEPGPVRVVLRVQDGVVTEVDTYVGGRWRAGEGTTDLGVVGAVSAARYLLALARRSEAHVGKEAILPAILADSATVWPDLLQIARDGSVPRSTRKSAVFWLGQAAGEAATAGLTELVDDESGDLEVRKTAVFALSQRPADEGVPALIEIARESTSPTLRKQAFFWLAQSDDPRALSLFEELLSGR